MPISQKQKQIMAFPFTNYDALVCDGAIRSGKTAFMMLSFVDDAMRRYNNQRFGICGKTVDSTVKNLIMPYIGLTYAKDKYRIQWKRTDKILVVSDGRHENILEVFGGKDESSFSLIQGRTLAGVLLDEVALQPRSFVEQACARCSVDGSKLWFNCNPASPQHWFYKEWVCQPKKHNAIRLHFLLEDNPSLSQRIIDRYNSMYTGVFYNRYILGEWCVAEGLVYPMFGQQCIAKTEPREYTKFVISMDYGIQNATAMILWGLSENVWYAVKEFYHSGRETNRQKTDQQYYEDLLALAGDLPIYRVIIDPSAASFLALIEQKRQFRVWDADNSVIEGIQHTAQCLADGKIKINDCCKRTIQEFGVYAWEENSAEDKPMKVNDHAMDAVRYFVQTMQIYRERRASGIIYF